uniref:E3 ubiquitin/ISG15 ligase TRIM25-like n=1 Tax=Sinocyclocheilus anshuiensis TaxID=1608454 RepID=A0A671L2L8_9TELE
MSQSKPEERLALELSCAICLQLYRDPVALPCGHNYCLGCIQNAASTEDPKSLRRCPECREEYGSPEVLPKNFKLSSIVDGFLVATTGGGLRGGPTAPCDQCLDDPKAAVKFCTRCEMSLCPSHLKKHEERHRSLHVLVELPVERDGKRCPVHLKVTEYLCAQERLFLSKVLRTRPKINCSVMDDELHSRDKSWQANLCDLEGCLHQLQEAQKCTGEVLSQSSEFLFIQNYLNVEARVRQAANVTIPALPSQESSNAKQLRSILRTDTFRAEMSLLLEYLHGMMNPLDLTFNAATAHPCLLLSSDLKTAKQCAGFKSSAARDQSERFSTATQVMCTQGFSTGVHMWAVEVGPGCMWSVGLCYKSIPRKGDHSRLGHNTSSWRLQWKSKKLVACYDLANVAVGQGLVMPPKKVEVTLDYEGGTFGFHSSGQGGRRQHLHTFSAVFKDTVYPYFFFLLWKSMATTNCLITSNLQNIFFYVQHKKATHTGSERHEGE